jgi:hypothetical protein
VSPVLHTGRRRSDEAELIAGEKRPESAGKSSSPLQAGVVGLFSVQRRVGKIWRGEEVTGMSTWSLGGAECSWRNAAPSDGPAGRREAAGQSVPERLQQGGRSRASARSRGATTADQYWTTCIRAGALSAAETSTLVGSGKLHHTVTAHFRPSCLVAHWTTWTPFTTVCAANPRLLQARGDGKILCHVRPGMEPHKSSPAALRHTKQDHCRAISPIPSRAHMS